MVLPFHWAAVLPTRKRATSCTERGTPAPPVQEVQVPPGLDVPEGPYLLREIPLPPAVYRYLATSCIDKLITHEVLIRGFLESQLTHKIVHLMFTITN